MNPLAEYQRLLERYLSQDGGVLYQDWHDSTSDVEALEGVLSSWLARSPESHPSHFASASHRLGYWLNLYNALVIREILGHWPLDSVKDVRPTLLSQVAPLKGFFVDLRFDVAGTSMNLSSIENRVIRSQFRDARIHFALNCGSAACPILRRSVFDGDALEAQLDEASHNFVSQPENVRVDEPAATVWLSKIFKWYTSDFERHAAVESKIDGDQTLDFIAFFAPEPLREQLRVARASGYRIRYDDYDWSVNSAHPETGRPS